MYFIERNSINAKKSYDWLLDAKGNGFQQLISNLNLNRSCRLKTSNLSASSHRIRPRQLCLTAYYICSFNTGVYELGFLEWHAAWSKHHWKTCTMTSRGVCRIFVIASLKCIRFKTREKDCLRAMARAKPVTD